MIIKQLKLNQFILVWINGFLSTYGEIEIKNEEVG